MADKKFPTSIAKGRVKKAQKDQSKARSYVEADGAQGGMGSGKIRKPGQGLNYGVELHAAAKKAGITPKKAYERNAVSSTRAFTKGVEMQLNSKDRMKKGKK